MKKVLLVIIVISCAANGMQDDQNSSQLRKRVVLSSRESEQKKWPVISHEKLFEKNKNLEVEWAKISRLTHLKEAILESKVVLSVSLLQLLAGVVLYTLYNQIQQV